MQLGKTLLGAIVGSAVGIAILLVVYRLLEIDGFWLAIPFALITGLGVRMLVNTHGHASYARGALTMILTLAAYIGGWSLVAQMATARSNASQLKPSPTAAEAQADNSGDAKDADAKDVAPPIEENAPMARLDNSQRGAIAQSPRSTWGFIWLAIAAFVAYEMGRGSDAAGAIVNNGAEPTPQPGSTHPDA